jgi:hypothetical protein
MIESKWQSRRRAPASTCFRIEALDATYLEEIRRAGQDRHGNPTVRRVVSSADAGSPLRCCLREAQAGEAITLIAHAPRGGRGTYHEVGPVFIHADRCSGYATPRLYPPGFRHRQQVFRAYDVDGRICDAVLVDGAAADPAIDAMLSRHEIATVQSRNVLYGCFMFGISRAEGDDEHGGGLNGDLHVAQGTPR